MRRLIWILLLTGCTGDPPERGRPPAAPPPRARPAARRAPATPAARRPALKNPVSFFEAGREQVLEAAAAQKKGLTVLDLSDDWVPLPFQDTGAPPTQHNSYRARFVALANDRTDGEGHPLPPGRHNYLELYGIPPSLGALARRVRHDWQHRDCYARIDREALEKLDRSLHYVSGRKAARRFRVQARSWAGAVKRLLRKHHLQSVKQAEAKGIDRTTLRAYHLTQIRLRAIRAAQARLACEGVLRKSEPLTPGVVDWHHHRAMVRFERKHMLFGWGQIWGATRQALARPLLESHHRTLLRVLRERIANQLGVIEDGSVPARVPHAKEAGGVDRVGTLTRAAAKALGVDTPQGAHRFLTAHPPGWFAHRKVALRLPPRPAYYTSHMDLQAIIDRGDVWYDFPYDAQGKPRAQPIARRPHLTLYVRYREKRLPLVRWNTTIGGWRTEVHRGCHYWKYKDSDVGPRLWKYLVAGPVWLPPPGTPPRDLVARVLRGGRVRLKPKQWEIGPGYRSAYGLVAALHTREVRHRGQLEDEDGGIRTHGSADYMSILTSHSHGCHRLHNHLAIRLVTFLLRHRRHVRLGEQPIRWRYFFRYQGKAFHFRRDHKGYYVRLQPPVEVVVTRGHVQGTAQHPILRYVQKTHTAGEPAHCPAQPGHEPAPRARPQEAPDARPHP